MKHLLVLMAVLGLSFSQIGCGGDAAKKDETKKTDTTKKDDTAKKDDTMKKDDEAK